MLLEKAWAKACGSYGQSIGGLTSEALLALTGAPVTNINHKEVDANVLWDQIYNAD